MNAPLELTQERAFPALDFNLIPATPGGHMGDFFAALAAAQGAFEQIQKNKDARIKPKDATKQAYTFKYADLAEILDKTKAGRTSNNLALTQLVTNKSSDQGGVMIRTILGHSSGARMESVLDVPRGREGEVKDFGAYITYLRRYIVGPMLGVSADDDLDDNGDGMPGDEEPTMRGYIPPSVGNPAPSNPAESPILRDAKSVKELTTAFNKFSSENKDRYRAHYERLLEALDTPMNNNPTATGKSATNGKPAATAAAPAQQVPKKDDL
ncbi:ERF family protein [Paraburkholderia sp. C35]|uniref:ERF family protein n=1 Tax=Paraburkholderia sp. C35 TaxID=2126993 RepID=UPI000D68AC0F|nr:ERF family protein [Paraburkholderia sp. C35]